MVTKPSADESQQLLQTVEMFEAITAIQTTDYQSLEILREAYSKLGRADDTRRTTLRLAAAYANLGQTAQAIREYTALLEQFPADPEATACLAALDTDAARAATQRTAGVPPVGETSKQTPPPSAPFVTTGAGAPSAASSELDGPARGDQDLANVLVAEKLVTPQAVQPLLSLLQTERPASIAKGQAPSLVQLMVDQQLAKLEDLLGLLVAKSGKPYLPLSYYDVDRDTAFLLPRELVFPHCLIPFDLISRSVLIATANPFAEATREEIEGMLDYRVFWYISPPAEITAALRRVHGLEGKQAKAG